jgi:hypothetical protein
MFFIALRLNDYFAWRPVHCHALRQWPWITPKKVARVFLKGAPEVFIPSVC